MDERATRQDGEWLIVHAIRRTWWHIDEGWDAVPRENRRRWMRTLILGLIGLLAFTTVLVFATRTVAENGLLAWEPDFVRWFEEHAPFSFGWAIWIESPGNGVVLWPLVIVAAGIAAWRRQTLLALTIFGGFLLIDAAVLLGWQLWRRARPDLIAGGIASSAESFSAFPSGHVSQSVVVYGLLVALWLRRTKVFGERVLGCALVAFIALAVAAGRLRLGAHWPSDVVAGAVIGGLWLAVLVRALRAGSREA
jgi:membrane-associated phospholipid phosphatase